MLNRLALALAALLMLPCAAMAETLEGTWALRIDDTTIFRFDLRQGDDGNWQGVWARPRSYRNNGVIFSSLDGRAEVMSRSASIQGDALRLTFNDPRPRSLPEVFRFRVTGEGTAELTYVDTGFAPLPLVRVGQGTEVGPFEDGRLYDRDNAQTEPARLAVPARAAPAPTPQPERPVRAAQPVQELPALATPAPRPQPVAELPALATPAPGPRVQPEAQPQMPAEPASSVPQGEVWRPDPSVSAAIATRAAALDGAAAPAAAQPMAEPELPATGSADSQTGVWQADPSVRAAIAARAAALNGLPEPAEESEATPARPDSGLGADFLEGL
ncbi:hypothetical protein [Aurantiacibacter flavus]|uniref:Uncharacterized protein n=1 Tax=Aurantiacibacter flavus TaxID=3145232 RepID=A0ABV0CY29_9SPHN